MKMTYGTEHIKKSLAMIASLVVTISDIDSNEDGTISTIETFGFASVLIPQLLAFSPLLTGLKQEIKDLDSDEIDEIVAYLVSMNLFDESANKEDLERFIDDTLLCINYNRRYVIKAINFFRKDNKSNSKA